MSGTISLADARIAVIAEAQGRHSIAAFRVLPQADQANPLALSMAIAAQVTTIDGRAVTYEDLLDLPLADVNAIQGAMQGGNGGNGGNGGSAAGNGSAKSGSPTSSPSSNRPGTASES